MAGALRDSALIKPNLLTPKVFGCLVGMAIGAERLAVVVTLSPTFEKRDDVIYLGGQLDPSFSFADHAKRGCPQNIGADFLEPAASDALSLCRFRALHLYSQANRSPMRHAERLNT